MKPILTLLLLTVASWGQTPAATFPTIPLPAAVAAFASFDQLGDPKLTAGFSAIYPLVGSVGVYATTTADVFPKGVIDPTTKKHFYAISASIRQGVHKDLFDVGRFSLLLGGDVGPGFSQAAPSGINVSLSTSFVATPLIQVSPLFSLMFPVRMLYVKDCGWNPVVEAGFVVNLDKLKAKK